MTTATTNDWARYNAMGQLVRGLAICQDIVEEDEATRLGCLGLYKSINRAFSRAIEVRDEMHPDEDERRYLAKARVDEIE